MGSWSELIHGTDAEGREVTARFGEAGTDNEGHTLLADGHLSSQEFDRANGGGAQHDHYNGQGGGTTRGHYTGKGS